MSSVIIEGVFINLFSSLIYDIGKYAFKAFLKASPVQKAITDTSNRFANEANVNDALQRWCESDEFVNQIQKLTGTIDALEVDLLINSFIRDGGFIDNVNILNPFPKAKEVLEYFFHELEKQLFASEYAGRLAELKADLRHRAVQSSLGDISEQIRAGNEDVKNHASELFKNLPVIDIDSSPEVQEKLYFREIDVAVELLKKGKVETALEQLKGLRSKLAGENVSVNLHYRIAANIGICLIQNDSWEEAKSEFEYANKLKPDNKLILSYLALIATFENDAERAEEFVVKLLPAEENKPAVTAHFIRVAGKLGRFDLIEKLLSDEDWVKTDPDCVISLGLIKFEQGEYEESEAYFRTALEAEEKNPHAFRLLAQAIIVPLDETIMQNPPLRMPEDMRNRYIEAKNYLTEAIDIFARREEISNLNYSLLQRAYVSDVLEESEESLKDLDRILITEPKNDYARRQKGDTLLHCGETEKAFDWYSQIDDEERRDEAILGMALGYNRTGDYTEVLSLLEDKLDISNVSRQQSLLIDLLLIAYHFLEKNDEISELISKIDDSRPSDPEMLALTARHFYRLNDFDESFRRYNQALENAQAGNQADRIQIEIAEAYYSANKWEEAANLYNSLVEEDIDSPLARRFLASLYNSGARDRALAVSSKLRGGGQALPFISEIEADIYVDLGEYEKALALFVDLYSLDQTRIKFLFDQVDMLFKLERFEEAKQLIESVKYEDVKDDAQGLVDTAFWRQKLNMGDELVYAYQARRIAANMPNAHMAYLQTFFKREKGDSSQFDSLTITNDSVVYLKIPNHDEISIFKFTEEYDFDVTKGEIHVSDPRVPLFLGKSVGETIIFNEGQINENRYEVIEIKNKYVEAFQETLKKFNDWFSAPGSITPIKVADNDFSNLFKLLANDRQRNESILGLFNNGNLPVVTLSQFLGKNYFETWYSVIGSTNEKIFAVNGGTPEREQEAMLAERSDEIIIDLSGLLTMSYLNLLDKLPQVFTKIYAPFSLLETLKKWREAADKEPHPVLWEENGQMFYREITAEILENRKCVINEMIAFVEAHVESLPANKVLSIKREHLNKYQKAFGKNFHSVMLAVELNKTLYIDDRQLTIVFNDLGYKTQSISVQSILLKFKSKGTISLFDYRILIKRLILSNYFYMSVNAADLWRMTKDESNQATDDLKKILDITLGKYCEPSSAMNVGAEYLRRLCLEMTNEDEKHKIIDSTIASILSNRNTADFVQMLRATINIYFRNNARQIELITERLKLHTIF